MPASFHDVFCASGDGLTLHAREIHPEGSGNALPVLCLPGLTRTTADFAVLAHALADDPATPRRVVAIDYRGRGQSGYDPDPTKYAVPIEMGDVRTRSPAYLGISKAILVGTSRGGLISMVMAAAKSPLPAAIVLNDIGPALEMAGLLKIKGYVGVRPRPASWDAAAHAIKTMFARFPRTSTAPAGWPGPGGPGTKATDASSKPTIRRWRKHWPGLIRTHRCPNCGTRSTPMTNLPLMLIHGALSDLLSRASVEKMVARRPDLDLVTVPDQGHAPLLADAPTIARIAAFCARCDRTA